MAPRTTKPKDSGSDSDSDAPETVSLHSASKAASDEAKKLLACQQEKQRKDKEKRRATDRRLKAQKEEKKERKEKTVVNLVDKQEESVQITAEADAEEEWGGVTEEPIHDSAPEADEEIPDYLPDEMFEKAFAQ